MQTSRPHSVNGSTHADESLANGTANSNTPLESSTMVNLSGLHDPFNLSSSLMPNPAGTLASNLSSAAVAASLNIGAFGRRKPGPRAQPGLPPAHFLVTSGAYNQFGKSLAGLAGLRGDEVDGDLGEVRRKRVRTGASAARRRAANGE